MTRRLEPPFLGVATGILFLAFGLHLWGLGEVSLWIDEIATFLSVRGSLAHTLETIARDGVHVPLYFLLQHLFPIDPPLAMCYSAVLTGTLGVALLASVARRLHTSRSLALWAGMVLAVNPFHTMLSRNARPYALLFFMALLSSYFFLRLLEGKRTRQVWIGFVLSSEAAYLTHYFALFLPVVQYLIFGLYLEKERPFFRRWLGRTSGGGQCPRPGSQHLIPGVQPLRFRH